MKYEAPRIESQQAVSVLLAGGGNGKGQHKGGPGGRGGASTS